MTRPGIVFGFYVVLYGIATGYIMSIAAGIIR